MVVDPLFTLPLVVAAAWGFRRPARLRRAAALGLLIAYAYLVLRIGSQSWLTARVAAHYPGAQSVQVFPSWFGPVSWRYVAVLPREQRAGAVRLLSAPLEQGRHPRHDEASLSREARASGTVREALAWARFPLLDETARPGGGSRVTISDLRYHLNGEPTLTFRIDLDPDGSVSTARLDRGGSAMSLLERLRGVR